jgi:hypothetical protein
MNNLLNEELAKFKKLSNYNTKMTLTENESELLKEYGLSPAATAREVESAIGKNLENFMRELKLSTKSVSEVTALLEKDAKSFQKEFAKAMEKDIKNNFPKGTMGPAAKEMSKIDVMRKLAAESGGRKLKPEEINKIIDEAAAANKLKVSQYVPRTPRTPRPKPNAEEIKIIDNTVKKYPTIKNWPWARLSKWGLGAGLTMAVLYGIYKLTHDDEPPLPPSPSPAPSPAPVKARYRNCPSPGPYTQGCKSESIKPVQTCLGLIPDGKFWVKTQAALVAKGFPNGFTDADVSKICGGTIPPSPAPVPAPNPDETIDTSQDLVTDQGV